MYNTGDVVQGYTIQDLIAVGNNSVAYVATDATGRKVFFKAYRSPSIRVPWYRPFIEHQKEMNARLEGSPCRQFCHASLGGFEYSRKFHQVFEFLDKSHSLEAILQRIKARPTDVPWNSRESLAKVLVAGVVQLHAAKIVHADLKPDSVRLSEAPVLGARYRLRIVGLDFSFFTDKKSPWLGHDDYFGTPGYMSPEHGNRKAPVPASDVFSLGILLYRLLGPGHPYPFDDNDKILAACKAYRAERPNLAGVPSAPARADAVATMPHRCLHPDPGQRPSAAELHGALLGETFVPRAPEASALPPPANDTLPAPRRTEASAPPTPVGETRPAPRRPDVPAAGMSSRIGRYEVRRILGGGTFGRVYLAFDPDIERHVAVKVPLLPPDSHREFLREARVVAQLHHPNICPVYDVGVQNDLPFIVMRYVEGGTLETVLARGLPTPADALKYTEQVARGLEAAHARGVFHRDLKLRTYCTTRRRANSCSPISGSRAGSAAAPPRPAARRGRRCTWHRSSGGRAGRSATSPRAPTSTRSA